LLLCGVMESSEDGLVERMTKQFPDIPVLVLSGCEEFSIFSPALRLGAYDYLVKPFEREQLLAVVRRALEYRHLKLENRALRERLAKKESVPRRARAHRSASARVE
jgi:DNA-binding NtrC family response regulator